MTTGMHKHLNASGGQGRLPFNLTIIAGRQHIDALQAIDDARLIRGAQMIALELDEDIGAAHLPSSGVVVVQIDPQVPSSMRRLEAIHHIQPLLPVVVALEKTDLRLVRTLIREGVSDAISLPLQAEELLHAAATACEQVAQDSHLAPVVAVVRPLGGGGATTLVTHLAARLAAEGAATCLIDLDVQVGRVADVLGLSPRRTVSDLLDANQAIDATLFEAVVSRHSSGLAVIAAPAEILPIEAIDTGQVLHLIEQARRQFEFVFLDMPANLTNWSLSLLTVADEIMLLAEQNLASLRQTKRLLDLFRTVGLDDARVSLIVNRAHKKLFGAISTGAIEDTLQREVKGVLRLDEPNVQVAQDQGKLVDELRPKSSYAADIAALALELKARLARGHG